MSKKNVIKKIVLDVDGKEISLSPEQAQKLCTALMDLLKIKQQEREKEYVPVPYPQPYPVYPYKRSYWEYEPYRITWGNSSDGKCLCSAAYSASNETVDIRL